ncbi:MAG: HD domain-containing protein [Candidatus Gastranaerophilales bacterium]|nr:HD domain-containing protein [Candidatus Gastranaerophilales bacterium]
MNIQQNYKIVSFTLSETKMKKTMANLTIEAVENHEIFNAKLWEEDYLKYEKKYFKPNNIIFVEDGTYSEQYKNLIIKKMSLVEEASAGLSEEQCDALYNNLVNVINDLKNEKVKQAILLKVEENKDRLKVAPAAKNNHHNYIGGLLKHTLECVEIAKGVFKSIPTKIDEDLILSACIMHDFGKVFEYNIDTETGFVEVDENFIRTWVSHTQYGFAWANQNGFIELARIIAAHHGRKDWGAIIDLDEKNIEPELYLMHHIDDISAKFGIIKAENI